MTGVLPHLHHIRARGAQQRDESAGFFGRYKRIGSSIGHQHRRMREDGQWLGDERHHRAKKDGTGEGARAEQDEAAGDVRAVREAGGDDARGIEVIVSGRDREPRGEFRGAQPQVFDVEHAFGEAAEKPWHPSLEDLAARAEDARAGHQLIGERQKIVLVASRAVQEQQHGRAGILGGAIFVDERARVTRHTFSRSTTTAAARPRWWRATARATAAARAFRRDARPARPPRNPGRRSRARRARRPAP